MTIGKVTISIDLELAWGNWDSPDMAMLQEIPELERSICRNLLRLFTIYDVQVTWAVVAALMDFEAGRSMPGSPSAWYAPDVISEIAAATPTHDIGSHSGRHPVFVRLTRQQARTDLDYARDVHARNGLPFRSFVFPRNAQAHTELLNDAGIAVFRGPGVHGHPPTGFADRARNLARMMAPTAPPIVTARRVGNMVDIPGSMLLMGRNGLRRWVHPRITRRKLRAGLQLAEANGGTFHLWFHPSNFYFRKDEQFATLEWFLATLGAARDCGRLQVLTMRDHVRRKS